MKTHTINEIKFNALHTMKQQISDFIQDYDSPYDDDKEMETIVKQIEKELKKKQYRDCKHIQY